MALSLTDRERAVLIARALEAIDHEGGGNNSGRFQRLKRFLAKLDPDGGIQSDVIGGRRVRPITPSGQTAPRRP